MGERGCVGEPVEHLRHPRFCGVSLVAPISGGQGVFEAVGDVVRFDGRADVEVSSLVETALQVPADVLGQFPEENPEESPQQRPGQVHAFFSEMVAVVLHRASQLAHEQFVDGVPEKITFFDLAAHLRADVRQHLLLQDTGRVSDPIVLGDVLGAASSSNKIQRHVLPLDDEGLLERGPEDVHHLPVRQVVHDQLDDVAIRHVPKRAEHHHDGHVRTDVRQRRPDLVALHRAVLGAASALPSLVVHLDVQRGGGTGRILHLGPRLDHPRKFTRVLLFEGVHVVVRHALLRHDHFFRAVDDEVSALVVDALAQIGQLRVVLVAQHAEETPKHDGHVPQELLRSLLGHDTLPQLILDGALHALLLPLPLLVLGIRVGILPVLVHRHVHVQRRRIRHVPQPRLVRKHVRHGTVHLHGRRLAQVHLPEQHLEHPPHAAVLALLRLVHVVTDHVLDLGRHAHVAAAVVHELLHGVLDELVERVQLLTDQTLLREVRRDHGPRVLLRHHLRVEIGSLDDAGLFAVLVVLTIVVRSTVHLHHDAEGGTEKLGT
mmetsp:Transcript_5657/g.11878  ORF Transcript_5657/g.11878 Transcript_5657/m.11878 type:complete len:546 (-) Transcript_5657:105-1742(-)